MGAVSKLAVAAIMLLFTNLAFAQQLKLGKNPAVVEKSAVLELNSDNQGLLLARIADTSLINVLTPPDGMVIYFIPTKQILIRTNGYWQPLALTGSVVTSLNGNTGVLTMDTNYISNFYQKVRSQLSAGSGINYNTSTGVISSSINTNSFWNTGGNPGTNPSTDFIGTSDNNDLVFKTNNTENARIVASTGDIKIGSATTGTIRSTQELVLRQDGDTYGPSILRLRNRTGENGAIFETTDPSITLVDFIFKTSVSQRNIRYESRSGYAKAGTPSFHIGGASPDNPTLAVGDTYAAFNTNLKIGNYNTPTEALDVTGNVRFSGALMPNNNAGTSGYFLQSNGSGAAPTWKNYTLSNLNDVSLSSLSNGQLLQYNGTNWVNITPAYLTSIDTSNISNFYLKVRSLLSGGTGISYNNSTGVITNSGVTSLNGNTGALTMDTSYISNFFTKVRSLHTVTAPLTYNPSTGVIGITQATTSTDGYLSSTDWNTFNSKQSTGNYLVDPGGNGIVARTALNTTVNRTITGTTNRISITNGDGVSGNPTIDVGSNIVDKTVANTYTGGAKQTFVNSATTAGLNLTASADPSTPASGDFWNSTTTANSLKYRDAASTTRTLVDLSLSQTLTNKTISGSSNTITNIPNSALTNSSITVATGTTGTDFNVSGSPVSLGGTVTLNMPIASGTNTGKLSSTDWNTFNNKANAFSAGNLTETGSSILTITGGTGAVVGSGTSIQVKQANTTQSGFLSSTDWNTFNGKSPALTFSTGLTNTTNTITNDLSTGISASNQNIYGSTSASGTLTLNSTSNATKGKILFGNSAYDEVNNSLNIGTTTTLNRITVGNADKEAISRDIRTGSLEIMGGTSEATGSYFQITGDQHAGSPYEGSAEFVIRDLTNSQFALFSYDGASNWVQRFQLKGASGDTYLTPNGGKISVGGITPTANLHLSAGSAIVNTAPLKFTAGTNLTTPEDGAVEYSGTHFYVTIGSTRYQLDQQSINSLNDPGANGIVVRTALNTTVNRTITGTTNRISITNGDGVSGNPAIDISSSYVGQSSITTLGTIATGTWHGTALTSTYLPSEVVYNDQSNTYTSGSKQIFDANNTSADIRLLGNATDPTTLSAGDVWYNSTNNVFKGRFNTTTRQFATLDGTETLTNKTISGSSNTITNIPNSALTNSSITVATGTTGTDVNVSGSPISLGGTVTLNIPIASATNSGKLSSTDWNTFNSKQSTGNYLVDPGGNGIVARTALNTTVNRTITGTTNRISITNGDGVSGNPTIDVGSNIVDKTVANTYTGGAKQTFVNSATTAGLNLTASADPSTPASGDFWNSTTTANSLKYRDAASTTRTLVDLSLSQTLTNKTISGSSNTITNIPNSALTNSSITVATGTTGTDFNVSGSPVSLGGTVTLNMPIASGTNTGKLSSTDWNTFNNKANAFSAGNLTETGSSILTITGGTGAVVGSGTSIQVKQANTTQSGFLSSTDWNTFNNKVDAASPTLTGITTINSLNLGIQSIATAAGTTTLTLTSPYYTVFTGSTTQNLVLPNATTLDLGQVYVIENNSTGAITVKANGGTTIWTIAATAELRVILTANGTAAGTWQIDYLGDNYATGKLFTVNNTLTFNGTDGTTMTFPTTSKTIAANDGSNWTISGQAIGDIPVASSTTAYGKLADVATGSVLISGGVGVAPSWSATPSITSPASTDNSTKVATTAFVKSATQPMSSSFTTLTPGATVTFTPAVGTNVYTLIPAQIETINMGTVPAGCVGQLINLIITTSGTTSFTLTFGTNIKSQGTLATGTTTAKKFVIQYLIESTTSVLEVSRTIAL